jgi:hypothetical protein
MLALAVREAAECRGCGGNLVETTDYDSWQWEPQPPVVCLRCLALHKSVTDHAKNPEAHGMIHQVHRRPRPPRKKRRSRR